jgi:hypothetical protein
MEPKIHYCVGKLAGRYPETQYALTVFLCACLNKMQKFTNGHPHDVFVGRWRTPVTAASEPLPSAHVPTQQPAPA